MAAGAQPDLTSGGAGPDSGSAPASSAAPPSQGPANQKQVLLAQIYQLCKRMAAEDPVLSSGMMKACQGIQEAQTALVSGQNQPQPAQSNPPY